MIAGLLCGLALYAVTTFPFALVTGVHGGTWGGICMLYAVICGALGVALFSR